ncbi:hypothetical protein [Pseudoduganella violacea]|uniref:Cellulose synthase/poly-beta-1,6-N-acetylglucosamine synthase-like glycosyltransferase n=1 Tax=Pseudoduganella violacea TaxID=1715466 RepID=A0A7W5BEY3_9BURK|nr:hypothetical protein [Pseudoduganella violacea]MBB3121005.1 cellulose synthase/poly-beta-1,6-N-acetylglucosamine synthase-like glycosyltransferase [Pseudoduganella violacea]
MTTPSANLTTEQTAGVSPANFGVSPEVNPGQIAPERTEITEDKLSKLEGSSPETRAQRLANDLVEQRHRLQREIFSVAIVAICVFYLVFLLMVVHLVCGGTILTREFPVTATVLVGMLGSIPTILSACLLFGLFRSNEPKDQDEKSDWNPLLKGLMEIARFIKPPSH